MASPKTNRTGKRRARRGRRKTAKRPMWKVLAAVTAITVIVAGAVLLMRAWAPPDRRPATAERQKSPAGESAPSARARGPEKQSAPRPAPARPPERPAAAERPAQAPLYEVFPMRPPAPPENGALHAAIPPAPPELPALKKPPRLAIIIDDIGHDRAAAEKLIALDAPLTLALLPHSPHLHAIAESARRKGLELMLHLPMEPVGYPEVDPGPGTLLARMAPDELLQVLERNLDAVPHIRGVNNHMGSKLTAQAEQMYQIFSVLKRRGLYFIDSRTTEESVCKPSARLFQLPFAQRDVFLDHHPEPAFIRQQLRELIQIAQRRGEAVGIAHPYPATYQVLKEELRPLREKVELVPASQLTRAASS
ncbi:MAG: divergent polysaccharide deacetylase family protein [Desulfobacterales bacterium]|nr:divergent polysaccharide deacetylase family protein [Desulfobacterales bacterium]